MKRSFQRLLCVVLAVILTAAALSVSAFAASGSSKKKKGTYKTYVCIGDSVFAGHSLSGYYDGKPNQVQWKLWKGSIPYLISKSVKAKKTYQLAHSGLRTDDLLQILDSSYKGDGLVSGFLPTTADGSYDYDGIARLRKYYKKYIKSADLITVNIGFNDTWMPILAGAKLANDGKLKSAKRARAEEKALAKQGFFAEAAADTAEATKLLATVANNPSYYRTLLEVERQASRVFYTNFDKIMRIITKLNPNARIVVCGYYNPFREWRVGGALDNYLNDHRSGSASNLQQYGLNYGRLFDRTYKDMNNYVKSSSPYAKKYKFADVGEPELLTNSFQRHFWCFDPHPTKKGYSTMASRILKVIKS